jgi:hypothetical protein
LEEEEEEEEEEAEQEVAEETTVKTMFVDRATRSESAVGRKEGATKGRARQRRA